MLLPNGEVLMHGSAPYDPVKAHEYYERTKKLKGRKKGGAKPPTKQRDSIAPLRSPRFQVKTAKGTTTLSAKQLAEQKAYAAKRVTDIKKKLAKLETELKKRMAEARKKEREAKKPDSAAEKAEKARDSEKYRDKNQQKIANKSKSEGSSTKSKSTKSDSVESLKKTIGTVQKSLKAAVAKQRSISSATRVR